MATRSADVITSRPVKPVDRWHSTTLSGIKVLVVDDDAVVVEAVGELLAAAGATVTAGSSVSEGIALVKERRPHIIISDLGMPERDGYQLIKVVRTLSSNDGGRTPAIALSGHTRNEDCVRALLSGYQVHLAKPVHAQHLIATIMSLIAPAS
jgi:CheY-like chemotaxis protein